MPLLNPIAMIDDLLKRIVNLEQQVANQALAMNQLRNAPPDPAALQSQAAATQATEHLYAPLRSDTKPLLEMSAFVREIAEIRHETMLTLNCRFKLADIVEEAQQILKRST